MLATSVRNRALNNNLSPASLVHTGQGSVAALGAQTEIMSLTVFMGSQKGVWEERFDLITNQDANASGGPTLKPIQASPWQYLFLPQSVFLRHMNTAHCKHGSGL